MVIERNAARRDATGRSLHECWYTVHSLLRSPFAGEFLLCPFIVSEPLVAVTRDAARHVTAGASLGGFFTSMLGVPRRVGFTTLRSGSSRPHSTKGIPPLSWGWPLRRHGRRGGVLVIWSSGFRQAAAELVSCSWKLPCPCGSRCVSG